MKNKRKCDGLMVLNDLLLLTRPEHWPGGEQELWWILRDYCAASRHSASEWWLQLQQARSEWAIADLSIEVNQTPPAVNRQRDNIIHHHQSLQDWALSPWALCSTRVSGWCWALSTPPTHHSKLSRRRTSRWDEHDIKRNLSAPSLRTTSTGWPTGSCSPSSPSRRKYPTSSSASGFHSTMKSKSSSSSGCCRPPPGGL